jgi:hypothetical protein
MPEVSGCIQVHVPIAGPLTAAMRGLGLSIIVLISSLELVFSVKWKY